MAVAMSASPPGNFAGLRAYVGELFHRMLISSQYAGCLIMWYGSITAALTGRVPPGVTCWLTTGIFFLFYQQTKLRKAAKNAATSVEYWRRMAMLGPVRLHLMFNAFALIPLWGPVMVGARELPRQDIIGFLFCIISVILVLIAAAWLDVPFKAPWVLFLLALSTRVVEQGAVAFSDAVAVLPYPVVNGLLFVALQIAASTFLEFQKARRAKKSGDKKSLLAYQEVYWTFLSALCNFASALLVWSSWQLSR